MPILCFDETVYPICCQLLQTNAVALNVFRDLLMSAQRVISLESSWSDRSRYAPYS